MSEADIIIIGSGMGGATLAAALAPSGKRILILERGARLLPSPNDRDDKAIFGRGVFRPKELWLDGEGNEFNPGNYYYVGGNSKFFGGVFLRYREMDFSPISHLEGQTFGWPISYQDLEPYYQRAEALYQIRGVLGEDPSEPPHSGAYPYPPVPDEPSIADFRNRMQSVGLHPASLPLGVDLPKWLAAGNSGWDAYPNTCFGKQDAESVALKIALESPNVRIQENTKALKLTQNAGKITGVEVEIKGNKQTLSAPLVVVAAGAVQSAVLLLASQDEANPTGLANSSDELGRNFMNHNTTAIIALHPMRKNTCVYQKTLTINDYYVSGGPGGEPLGNVQLLGKITGDILKANAKLPQFAANWIASRGVDVYAMSEDLPNRESRVTLKNGQIVLDWKKSNWQAHEILVKKIKSKLKEAGYPIVLSRPFDRRTPSHQCGTARMGVDPKTSVTNSFGRTHDIDNLFIVDASILPTSAAVNPSLTIAALALRTADHIQTKDWA